MMEMMTVFGNALHAHTWDSLKENILGLLAHNAILPIARVAIFLTPIILVKSIDESR